MWLSMLLCIYSGKKRQMLMKEVMEMGKMITSFHAEIVKQLKLRGMTQKELAEELKCSYGSVRSFISGHSENEKLAQRIAEHLGIER